MPLASVATPSCRRAASATLVCRCRHPVAPHRGHRWVAAQVLCAARPLTSRSSSSWCKELRCVAHRAVLGVTVLLAATCAVRRAAWCSCATRRPPPPVELLRATATVDALLPWRSSGRAGGRGRRGAWAGRHERAIGAARRAASSWREGARGGAQQRAPGGAALRAAHSGMLGVALALCVGLRMHSPCWRLSLFMGEAATVHILHSWICLLKLHSTWEARATFFLSFFSCFPHGWMSYRILIRMDSVWDKQSTLTFLFSFFSCFPRGLSTSFISLRLTILLVTNSLLKQRGSTCYVKLNVRT
jgi:hypothetical protein